MENATKIRSGVLLVAALLIGIVAAIYATRSSGAAPAKLVSTAHNKTLGMTILVNSRGRSLYSLSVERHGKFICTTSACLSIWRPLTVHKGTRPTGVAGPRDGQAARRQDSGRLPRSAALRVRAGHEARRRQGQRLQGRRRVAGGRGLEGQGGSGADAGRTGLPLLRFRQRARGPLDPRRSRLLLIGERPS